MAKIYNSTMIRRFIAVSLAIIWLALFAVDMADDSGLIQDVGADADQAVDEVLADFGLAVKVQAAIPTVSSGHSIAQYLGLLQYFGITALPSLPKVSLHRANQEALLLKKHARIYELHEVFLI